MYRILILSLHVFVSIIHSRGCDVHLNIGHFPLVRGLLLLLLLLFEKNKARDNDIRLVFRPLLSWRRRRTTKKCEVCPLGCAVVPF